jgi:methyl-accepting chemotaxis protein
MNEDTSNQSSKTKVQNKDDLKKIFLEPTYGIKGKPLGDDRGHKSFMGGSSYGTRRWLILITSIIAFCCMAALLFKGDQLLTHALQQIRTASYFSNFVLKIESEIVALNSDSNNFIWTKDIRYAENYNKRAEILIRELNILVENREFPTSQKLSTTVYDGIVEHKKQFSKIIEIQKLIGFNDQIGILANANTSLVTLEKRLSQLTSTKNNIKLQNFISNIKISEIKLAQDISIKKQEEIKVLINLLSQAVLNAKLQNKEKRILKRLIQSHSNDITQLSRSYMIYNKAKTRLGEISAYIAPSINTIINFNDNLKLLTRQENRETHALIRQIILSGTSGILLLLIISHMIIIRSISIPSETIAETAMELAHGNVSAPIPYLANSDATGQLSNTLIIFRENMLQADRLRKDLEIARQKDVQPSVEYVTNSDNSPSIEEYHGEILSNPDFSIDNNTISNISNKITTTSQNASNAFEEVERTEIMVSGLEDTADKIEDIEILMVGINDQISLLAVQTALHTTNSADEENLIHLYEKRDRKKTKLKSGSGQSVDDRIKSIQEGTKKVIKDVQEIGTAVNDANQVAREISNSISREALEAANQLLRQSEDLRTILDNILDKTQNENTTVSKPDL